MLLVLMVAAVLLDLVAVPGTGDECSSGSHRLVDRVRNGPVRCRLPDVQSFVVDGDWQNRFCSRKK